MKYELLFSLLLIAAAIAVRFLLPAWAVIAIVFVATAGLARNRLKKQEAIALLVFLAALAAAMLVTIPLPALPPLVRLGIIISFWGTAYSALSGYAVVKSMRDASSQQKS